MTVAELIETLQTFPPDMTVLLEYDGTLDTPHLQRKTHDEYPVQECRTYGTLVCTNPCLVIQ